MEREQNNIVRDAGIIALSIVLAILLAQTGALKDILTSTREWGLFGSFAAGIFFVSIFTTVPAAVVLVEIAQEHTVWEVALFGGMGALVGDLLIFRFIRDSLAADIAWFLKKTRRERLFSMFHLKLTRWLIPLLGALIIASPLPDEIGLAMMGFSKMKLTTFIPTSFTLNFLGILAVGLIAKGIL